MQKVKTRFSSKTVFAKKSQPVTYRIINKLKVLKNTLTLVRANEGREQKLTKRNKVDLAI